LARASAHLEMPERIYRVIEEEEIEEKEEPLPPPVEVPIRPPAEEWRERPFLLSVISLGLGGLGLLAFFYGLAMLVASAGPGIYVPGFGLISFGGNATLIGFPGGNFTSPGNATTIPIGIFGNVFADALLTASIMMGLGVAAYMAGYGLWHFRSWAFVLSIILAAIAFIFGITIILLQEQFLENVIETYELSELEASALYSTAMVTAVLAIAPSAFIIAYLLHVRHFFE